MQKERGGSKLKPTMKKIMRLKTVEKQVADGRVQLIGKLGVGVVEMKNLKTGAIKYITVK
jgi:hypothetical protein